MSYHEQYMRLALELAANAKGRTSPNPLVGAVIVKDGRVVGCGWHRKAGTPHAEVHALRQAGELARGADVYVTLEPCSHYGKTPPCAKALVEAGVKRVYAAMLDPNPKVAGRGFQILKDAGIETQYGLLEDEARSLNEVFLKWITHKEPFVVLKAAMTLDGKIATASGQSKWITNEASRRYGYRLRDTYDAIMVGVNTVIADDPSLTARVEDGKNPIRIVVDSHLKTPLDAQIMADKAAPVIIAAAPDADKKRIAAFEAAGAKVLVINDDGSGRVNLKKLLQSLGEQNICSILAEGGGTLHGSLIENNLVDKAYFFIAPKIVGGASAKSPVMGRGISTLGDAVQLTKMQVENLDGDILLYGRVQK